MQGRQRVVRAGLVVSSRVVAGCCSRAGGVLRQAAAQALAAAAGGRSPSNAASSPIPCSHPIRRAMLGSSEGSSRLKDRRPPTASAAHAWTCARCAAGGEGC